MVVIQFGHISVDQVMEFLAHYVFWASVVTLLMPPIEWFPESSKARKVYQFLLMILAHYSSLNFRTALWSKYIDAKAPLDAPKP